MYIDKSQMSSEFQSIGNSLIQTVWPQDRKLIQSLNFRPLFRKIEIIDEKLLGISYLS